MDSKTGRSHVNLREERVPARMLDPEGGVDCEIPHRLEGGTSVSEHAGPQRRVDCKILYWLERGTKHSL